MRRLTLVLSLAAAAVLAAAPARSERSASPGLHARAQQVLAQVDALDRQIEQVAEACDLASSTWLAHAKACELRIAL